MRHIRKYINRKSGDVLRGTICIKTQKVYTEHDQVFDAEQMMETHKLFDPLISLEPVDESDFIFLSCPKCNSDKTIKKVRKDFPARCLCCGYDNFAGYWNKGS